MSQRTADRLAYLTLLVIACYLAAHVVAGFVLRGGI